ncbi:adenosylcobinamide-phosphate synthase CbiB [Veillonella agrestimuris]|uniref:adenosylcobinamide-phosphate synthase CbiB n=1 Tax=Veillonella agrestimuris TaxID=2941340 RepID=UPI00203E23B1|nr:adenosylcobinamide-phosphate synthase CbiB [Veillonella agrestimuris]
MNIHTVLDWFTTYSYVCIPLLAFLLDIALGDPKSKFHPVVLMGRIISFFEAVFYKETDNDTKKLWYGGIAVGFILLTTYIITSLILWFAAFINEWVLYIVEILILYITISPRSLGGAGFELNRLLKQGSLKEAREKLSWIVGRDTEDLDESEITRATVETISENTIDGVVAPLFWFVIAGPIGAVLYRAANTMDSMMGYKNEKYLFFGRVAAKLDDWLNWIPARITFILFLIAAFILRFDAKQAFHITIRDAKKHPSPNSGYAEAPVAGALHIRLGGFNRYFNKETFRPYMGDPLEEMNRLHITRTIYMMYCATVLMIILSTLTIYGVTI